MIRFSKFSGHWFAVCAVVTAAMVLAGCRSGGGSDPNYSDVPGLTGASSGQGGVSSHSGGNSSSNESIQAAELLQPGEAVTITFGDTPTPTPPYDDKIKADGTITLLLENQTFVAAGKTRRALEEEIHDRYVPNIFKKMSISIKPQQQTQFYYVDGDVKMPGRQIYIERLTVLRAISSCGGFTDFAKRTKVKLTRSNGHIDIVNCPKALKDPKLDLEVFPGDKIWVPRRLF